MVEMATPYLVYDVSEIKHFPAEIYSKNGLRYVLKYLCCNNANIGAVILMALLDDQLFFTNWSVKESLQVLE